jgi:hypothetical protein
MKEPNQFHRHNHYVPCVYLKQFAGSDGRVATFQLLVDHERVPLWRRHSPRSIGRLAHLYTRFAAGRETDEIERWLDHDFESPAKEALRRATSDEPLRPADWECLARFVAAQDVRTPARLIQRLGHWKTTVPRMLEGVMDEAVHKLREAKEQGVPLAHRELPSGEMIPVRVTSRIQPGQEMGQLRAEMIVGRGLWFSGMRHLLTHTVKHLERHKWTILRPPEDLSWFTSDDPVIRLNYYGGDRYDFNGGWGNKGTEIVLPLGPQHLLCAQVGRQPPRRGTTLGRPQAQMIRRFIAEHAFRTVYAAEANLDVVSIRPRRVDADQVRDEAEQWRRWHAEQSEAERQFAGT